MKKMPKEMFIYRGDFDEPSDSFWVTKESQAECVDDLTPKRTVGRYQLVETFEVERSVLIRRGKTLTRT